MGSCFYHGPGHEVPGGEDEILLCESCVEEIGRSVLTVCANCGAVRFVDPQIIRETVFGDNPERPEVKEWLAKLPIVLVSDGCGYCQQESERAIDIQVFSGFTIEGGKVLL
jgi:hypothetical protein